MEKTNTVVLIRDYHPIERSLEKKPKKRGKLIRFPTRQRLLPFPKPRIFVTVPPDEAKK